MRVACIFAKSFFSSPFLGRQRNLQRLAGHIFMEQFD
jgi:hypothetical protein